MDGVSTADDYMRRAKEIGVEHLTITDHKTLSGHHDFQRAGKEHGISIGLGLEGYFSSTDRFDKRSLKERADGTQVSNHLGIIAQNEAGLKNLQHLNRIAWTEGFYNVPRVDLDLLEEYKDNLIVLSGCLSGVVAKRLEMDDYDAALEWATKFHRIFGENYYIEVMAHNPDKITKGQFQIADALGIKPIVTSDCHHASPEDIVLQEAMLILSTGPKKNETDFDPSKAKRMGWLEKFNYMYPDRRMTFEKFDLHLNTGIEQFNKLKALGYDRTDFIESTIEVADKIGDYPVYSGLDLLPKPKVDDVDAHLRKKVFAGLKKRGLDKDQTYIDRVNSELAVIEGKGFSTYFLIKANTDNWARKQGIRIGPGRGSGAGSLVNYCLWITNVDPIKYNLLFERFLDEFREDWPDIDTDYQDDRRDEVKQYMKRTFVHTGNIQTYTYLEGKNIFKDACKILRISFATSNSISQKIADWDDYLESTDDTVKAFRRANPEVTELGNMLRGRLRSVGMHAGGVVTSSKPLSDYAAVESAKHPDDPSKGRVEVLAMNDSRAADLGLIKFDILGVSALTNIQHTVDRIKERHGIELDMDNIPLDDPEVYKSITKRSTLGLFQLEGSAFTTILDQMPVEEFNDLVAGTSLIRPGAANASFGKRFLKARNGGDWTPYCEDMRAFTEDTFGEILYQEQLMLTVTKVAGMTTQESNKIRKIIGKKRDVKELEQYRDKFIDGAAEKLGGKTKAKKMWVDFEKSANYQFNKSHAVAYSLITYQTAWLKHYYPAEFMLSVLQNEDSPIRRTNYLNECKRLGIRIKVPHINESGIKMEIHDDDKGTYLRMGLADTKYVGDAMASKIVRLRPFATFEEFKSKAEANGINVRAVSHLDMVGACKLPDNPLKGNERDNYYYALSIPAFDTSNLEPHMLNVMRTLDEYDKESTFVTMALVQDVVRKGWQRADLFDETGTVGIFFNKDMDIKKGSFYIFLVSGGSIIEALEATELDNGSNLARYITTERLKPFEGKRIIKFVTRRTKTNKIMGTLVTTDCDKNLEAFTVFESLAHKTFSLAERNGFVNISATSRDYQGKTSYILQEINAA